MEYLLLAVVALYAIGFIVSDLGRPRFRRKPKPTVWVDARSAKPGEVMILRPNERAVYWVGEGPRRDRQRSSIA